MMMSSNLKRTRKMSESDAPPSKKAKYDFEAAAERRRSYLCRSHSRSMFFENIRRIGLDKWCEMIGIPSQVAGRIPINRNNDIFEIWYNVALEEVKKCEWTITELLCVAEIAFAPNTIASNVLCDEDKNIFLYLKSNIYSALMRAQYE